MADRPPWLSDAERKRRQNRQSAAQEARRATETGGRRQPGSGSSYRAPQDVKHEHYLEQTKYTDADSFSIKVDEWEQIKADAARSGREPLLFIEFRKRMLKLVITEEE